MHAFLENHICIVLEELQVIKLYFEPLAAVLSSTFCYIECKNYIILRQNVLKLNDYKISSSFFRQDGCSFRVAQPLTTMNKSSIFLAKFYQPERNLSFSKNLYFYNFGSFLHIWHNTKKLKLLFWIRLKISSHPDCQDAFLYIFYLFIPLVRLVKWAFIFFSNHELDWLTNLERMYSQNIHI